MALVRSCATRKIAVGLASHSLCVRLQWSIVILDMADPLQLKPFLRYDWGFHTLKRVTRRDQAVLSDCRKREILSANVVLRAETHDRAKFRQHRIGPNLINACDDRQYITTPIKPPTD